MKIDRAKNPKDELWWKHGVLYHVYVRSFFDSDNDGIGDLRGVTEKLDYIKEMGFAGIWLSPVYKSPMVDYGYDISDYVSVDPQYGTLEDLKRLIDEAYKRRIYIIMDIALNHTSDQHPWFIESRSSLLSKKRDWYIWRKGKIIGPPNNWITGLFESAWKYDRPTDEYYLHSFLKNQPDLNWRNDEVKKEFIRILEFWMDFGIAGFRLDMVNWLIKDKKLRDNPSMLPFKIFQKQIYNKNRSKVSPILKLIRQTVGKYPGRVTVGEVFTMPPGDPELSAFYLGNGKNSLHLAFDFSLMYRFWSARIIFKAVSKWITAVPEKGWPTHVLSNHDQKRSFTRLCRGKYGLEKARVLAVFLLALPGTPFVYYGEELGMKNAKFKRKQIIDPLGIKFWPFYRGRDSSRTPMKWNSGKNAGFSENEFPWLPVDLDYRENNVEAELANPDSLLNFYKNLMALRNKEKALHLGKWVVYEDGRSGVIGFFRKSKKKSILVLLNFKNKNIRAGNPIAGSWKVIFSTHRKKSETAFNPEIFSMLPFEATIYKLKKDLV